MKSGYRLLWSDSALEELRRTFAYLEENFSDREIRRLAERLEFTLKLIVQIRSRFRRLRDQKCPSSPYYPTQHDLLPNFKEPDRDTFIFLESSRSGSTQLPVLFTSGPLHGPQRLGVSKTQAIPSLAIAEYTYFEPGTTYRRFARTTTLHTLPSTRSRTRS